MGSQIAFRPMRSASFCSPHGLFIRTRMAAERDWSIRLGLQTETRTRPLPKYCPFDYRFCIHTQIEMNVKWTSHVHFAMHIVTFSFRDIFVARYFVTPLKTSVLNLSLGHPCMNIRANKWSWRLQLSQANPKEWWASVLPASPFLGVPVLTSFTMLEVIAFPCLSMAPSATMIMFSLVPLERVWTNRTTACLTDACVDQQDDSTSPWEERITVRRELVWQLRHLPQLLISLILPLALDIFKIKSTVAWLYIYIYIDILLISWYETRYLFRYRNIVIWRKSCLFLVLKAALQ